MTIYVNLVGKILCKSQIFLLTNNFYLLFLADLPFTHKVSAFDETIFELIDILQSGSEIVIDWFKNNKIIFNADKFLAILLDKRKNDQINQCIVVSNQNI